MADENSEALDTAAVLAVRTIRLATFESQAVDYLKALLVQVAVDAMAQATADVPREVHIPKSMRVAPNPDDYVSINLLRDDAAAVEPIAGQTVTAEASEDAPQYTFRLKPPYWGPAVYKGRGDCCEWVLVQPPSSDGRQEIWPCAMGGAHEQHSFRALPDGCECVESFGLSGAKAGTLLLTWDPATDPRYVGRLASDVSCYTIKGVHT